MTVEQLRNILATPPFWPFTIHLADGRVLRVFRYESREPGPRVHEDHG